MSRIGRQPVAIPKGVTVSVKDGTVQARGPKGSLSRSIPELVTVEVKGSEVLVQRADDTKPARERHGLVRSLVNNMVTGVTSGFEKKLEIVGVGFKAETQGRKLVMSLGFSHPVEYALPQGIEVKVDKAILAVSGADKELVGQTAANIRGFRPPDSYKGKGVRYFGEHIKLKPGKAGATAK
jgi:large subunit ribosomal protein L6